MNTHPWKPDTPVVLSEVDQTTDAETPTWRGTLEDFLRDNDLTESETARVCADLFYRHAHMTGGGAAQLFVLRVDA